MCGESNSMKLPLHFFVEGPFCLSMPLCLNGENVKVVNVKKVSCYSEVNGGRMNADRTHSCLHSYALFCRGF